MAGLQIDESREMDPASRRTFGKLRRYVDQARGLSRPANPQYIGQVYTDLTLGQRFYWDGTKWHGSIPKYVVNVGITGSTAGTVNTVACTIVIPDQQCDGQIMLWGQIGAGGIATAGDSFEVGFFYSNAAGIELAGGRWTMQAGNAVNYNVQGSSSQASGVSTTIVMCVARLGGTGVFNFFADPRYNRIDALFIPT